jgi:MFS transporter, DHA3 family, macrolide efflux protein
MRRFFILWAGQLVSTIGSFMTVFGLTIWVWEQTQSTTALVLVGFFSQIPRFGVTLVAGVLVDRVSRKTLMLLGEMVALLATAVVAVLYAAQQLQIWHLYLVVLFYGGFGQLQTLAYSASMALIVPPQQLVRAESLNAAVGYGAAIFAPALAGALYPTAGLRGIFLVDLLTFLASLAALLTVTLPQPHAAPAPSPDPAWSWANLTAGFRYIAQTPGLLAMAIAFSLFALPNDMNKALYSPLILARTNGNAQTLALVTTAAAIGGVVGGLVVSVWGGFRRRTTGMLLGFVGHGGFKVLLGLSSTPVLWMATHFLASLPIALFYSSTNAIWYAKVPPHLQGRVLGADQLLGIIISTVAPLVAGLLADRVLEPLARSGQLWGVGQQPGDGIAALYVVTACGATLVGLAGALAPILRQLDHYLPDYPLQPAPETADSVQDSR